MGMYKGNYLRLQWRYQVLGTHFLCINFDEQSKNASEMEVRLKAVISTNFHV